MNTGLDDEVRQAAFALLVRDHGPVSPARLAGTLGSAPSPSDLEAALQRLTDAGLVDRGPGGVIIGAGGLTLADGEHRLLLRDREYRTWCAYDAIGILAGLAEPGAVSTRCGVCGRRIAFQLPLPPGAEPAERLWLSAGGDDMRADFCAPTVLLCSAEHADTWAHRHSGRGRVLEIRSAWRLGAGAWAAYARAVQRVGAG